MIDYIAQTHIAQTYITKTVTFKYRGIDFSFALSQGLFSSADIDSGTRLLLKVLSRILDTDAAAGKQPPRYVLDAGCGAGVIGICAAAAISALEKADKNGGILVRAQDRDELARLVTSHNAEKNHIPPSVLEVYTEPLLAGPPDIRWDLILSNIPAKAGKPVLEDFVSRSAGLLNPGGRVIMVAVHTLAGFFREQIAAQGFAQEPEEENAEYSVLVFGRKALPDTAVFSTETRAADVAPVKTGPGFFQHNPFYYRTSADYLLEDIPLHIETLYGAPGFDEPGGAVQAAVKLIRRLGPEKLAVNAAPVLVHEPAQGFFPCWLLEFLRRETHWPPEVFSPVLVLSGRNILALEAARHNTTARLKNTLKTPEAEENAVTVVPAADLYIGSAALLDAAAGQGAERSSNRPYGFIAAFPGLLPQSSLPKGTDQFAALWESLPPLLAGKGVFIAGFSSGDAERFDRKKSAGFTRLGDIKRKGFRALAYMASYYSASASAISP